MDTTTTTIIERGTQALLVRHPLGYYLVAEPDLGITIAGGYLSEDDARAAFEIAESLDDHGWPEAEIEVGETGFPELVGIELKDEDSTHTGTFQTSSRAISGIDLPEDALLGLEEEVASATPHNLSGAWGEYEWRVFLYTSPGRDTLEEIADRIYDGDLTLELVSQLTPGSEIVDGILIPHPGTWVAIDGDDGMGTTLELEVATAEEAALEFFEGGEWGSPTSTEWVNVLTWREGIDAGGEIIRAGEAAHRFTIEPQEPECSEDAHSWKEVRVRGSGGGVVITDACAHCGVGRVTDTWATDPTDGSQGHKSISYLAPEEVY